MNCDVRVAVHVVGILNSPLSLLLNAESVIRYQILRILRKRCCVMARKVTKLKTEVRGGGLISITCNSETTKRRG